MYKLLLVKKSDGHERFGMIMNTLEFTSNFGVKLEVPQEELIAMFNEAGCNINKSSFELAMNKKEFRDSLAKLIYERILGGLRVFAEDQRLFHNPLIPIRPSNPGRQRKHSNPSFKK